MPNPLLVVALALMSLPAFAQQSPTLTVAAYNVENMFDVYDDPFTSDESQEPKPRKELDQLAAAIRAMDADVITFEELENEGLLRAFAHEMLTDMGYEYIAVLPTNSDRGINLGVMSRVPILSMTSHRFQKLTLEGQATDWRFARDALLVRLQVTPGSVLHLIALHLKSRHDSPDDKNSSTWRLAEAAGVRRIVDDILARDANAYVVVQGDLNDTPQTQTLTTIMGTDGPAAARLVDVHAGLPAEQRTTYRVEPYRSTIDYILVSPALAGRLIAGSARVLNDPNLIAGSDHCPVFASFRLD